MGRMVKETMETDGWTKVGFPLLQKMIHGAIGHYKDGEWIPGEAQNPLKNPMITAAYAQALMDFNNRFLAYVKNIKLAKETLKAIDESEKEQYTVPMINEGGSY